MEDLLSDEKFLENGLTLPKNPLTEGIIEDANSTSPESN